MISFTEVEILSGNLGFVQRIWTNTTIEMIKLKFKTDASVRYPYIKGTLKYIYEI